jgi:hypothetical protein
MITGRKPSGYFVTADGDGRKIEGETRQCIHCGYTWEYHPGSGIVRGWCLKCNGFVCAREECLKEQFRMTSQFKQDTGKMRSCIPFEEWNDRQREKQLRKVSNLSMI